MEQPVGMTIRGGDQEERWGREGLFKEFNRPPPVQQPPHLRQFTLRSRVLLNCRLQQVCVRVFACVSCVFQNDG